MKTVLKITLLVGAAASAIALPVSAGNNGNDLRGMFSPQSTLSEFEGRFVQPQSHDISWQEKRLQAPSTYAQASHIQEEGVRYYSAEEYYSRNTYKPQKQAHKKKKSWFGLGYGNVYDYESGPCRGACAKPATVHTYAPSRTYTPSVTQSYRQITQYQCWDGEIVSDKNGCKTQTITQTIPQYQCWDGEIVTDVNGCKRQTITREVVREVAATQGSYGTTSHSSFGSTSAQCPSGTIKQTDGTCLESSSTPISSYDSHTSYNSGSSFSGSIPTNCPSGTTAQSDGTCLEGGSYSYTDSYTDNPYAGSSVEIFTNDTTPTPSYGYNTDGTYGAINYPPLRK